MRTTIHDARIALQQWRAAHLDETRNYSRNPFEDTLRRYIHTLQPGAEMDALEAAWAWALDGFQGEEVTL